MALICSNCGKELPDNARFCSECGTPVASEEKKPDYCANCFAELPEGGKFCLQCGKPAVIAQFPHPRPESDKAIYDKLRFSSPQQVKYRDRRAVYESTGKHPVEDNEIDDFEEYKAEITQRASEWAEYETSGMEKIHWFEEPTFRHVSPNIFIDWQMEKSLFPTNKPNHHKTLFYEEFIRHYLYELRQRGVITFDDPPQPTPAFLDYLRKIREYTDEDIEEYELNLHIPSMEEIRSWPSRDTELFPPPQPLRFEAAGAIINLTTDEGAFIVYMDCLHKGKAIEIEDIPEHLIISFALSKAGRRKAEIIERTTGNTTVCSAIFNHIPFVLDRFKNKETVLQQIQVKLRFFPPGGYDSRWIETVTVFRADVRELDWRGRM